METTAFNNPNWLYLFIPYGLVLVWYLLRKHYQGDSALKVSSSAIVKGRSSFRTRTYRFLPVLKFASIALVILAMARPGISITSSSIKQQGIDIFIVLDVSRSMIAEDFQPKNRLVVAKKVVRDFISKRTTDRIGMVIFSGDAYLQAPLTIEKDIIYEILSDVDFDSVTEQGTAIGDALTLAASRMMDLPSRSKIILLLTDGMNNRGEVNPETAAKACKENNIKIYTVGIGKEGRVPVPGGFMGTQYIINHFDDTVLKEIASMTGGKFYRATSSGVLWETIQDIDKLEKTTYQVKQYHEFNDHFQYFLLSAALLFVLELFLRVVVYRKVPA